MKYIIDDSKWLGNHAGPKARNDVNFFLKDWETVYLIETRREGRSSIDAIKGYLRLRKLLKKDDVVLVQWPLLLGGIWQKYPIIPQILSCKKIVLIHDLVSLREKDMSAVGKEISTLNQFDVIISHNCHMTKWLKEMGIVKPIVDLQLFDYYSECEMNVSDSVNKVVVNIAGNLTRAKSGYLYQMGSDILDKIQVKAYGPNFEEKDGVSYGGSYPPEELPAYLKLGLGLVWDGESVDCVSGNYGHYMQYNNPHKLSLYIRCGLPVVVWKNAAIADFVRKHDIGICVKSLNEIPEVLQACTNERYIQMKKNVIDISYKAAAGDYINSAIQEALTLL